MRWKQSSTLDPIVIENELKQLERLDVPLLSLEAIIVYVPERLDSPAIQSRFSRLSAAGVLTEQALRGWLELHLPPKARLVLEGHLTAVSSRPAQERPPSGRVCCPMVIDYRSPLLPGETLSGVSWVEVSSRASDQPAITGFPEHGWPRRLEELAGLVRLVLGRPPSETLPHWRLLDSLGQTVEKRRDAPGLSTSLELGAALAYAQWLLNAQLDIVVGATGQITDERGSVASIDEPLAKMRGVAREAACVEVMLATAKDVGELAAAGVTGVALLPVASVGQAMGWLRRRVLAGSQGILASSSAVPTTVTASGSRSRGLPVPESAQGQEPESPLASATGAYDEFHLIDSPIPDASKLAATTLRRLNEIDRNVCRAEAEGRWAEVIGQLRTKSELLIDPWFRADVYAKIAWVHAERLGDWGSAAAQCEEALKLDPRHCLAIDFLLRFYLRGEEWDKLSDVLDRAVLKAPRRTDIGLLTEIARLASERLSISSVHARLWREILSRDRNHTEAFVALATVYESLGRNEDLARIKEEWLTRAIDGADVAEKLQKLGLTR